MIQCCNKILFMKQEVGQIWPKDHSLPACGLEETNTHHKVDYVISQCTSSSSSMNLCYCG